jgi:hypothetical protein
MALLCAGVAFVGFAPTYWLPMFAGTLKAHPVVHIHALVFFFWVVFFVVQTWLAATRRLATHRAMGLIGISIATTMTIAGILIAINRMHAADVMGQKVAGLAFAIVPLGSIAFFAIVFTAAVANIRRPDWHKRLMLVASVSILDAPIARWFMAFLAPDAPPGPPPVAVDIAPSMVAMLVLVPAMIVDWRHRGRVHAAFVIGAACYVALKFVQVPLSTTAQWHSAAEWIMRLGG